MNISKGEAKKENIKDDYIEKSLESMIIYAINSDLDLICMDEVIMDLREKIIEFNKSEKVKQEEYL